MEKERITAAIREILNNDCGFDAFVKMKDESRIRKLKLYEGNPTKENVSFKAEIATQIRNTIESKFLDENAVYSHADQIADEQNKFYVIRQDDEYSPFDVIDTPDDEIQPFSIDELHAAQGFLFRFSVDGSEHLWAYQHIWPTQIPKKKNNILMKILSSEQGDVFCEMKDPLFAITNKVDLLIVKSKLEDGEPGAGEDVTEIVTSDIPMMERTFGLETFIKASAKRVAGVIRSMGLVSNTDMLTRYLDRRGGDKRYSRKMMRIRNSKVLDMNADDLMKKLETVQRWKGKFEFHEGRIVLNAFDDVELLIDLYDERYTRSDITGQEYDTSVKTAMEDSAGSV